MESKVICYNPRGRDLAPGKITKGLARWTEKLGVIPVCGGYCDHQGKNNYFNQGGRED